MEVNELINLVVNNGFPVAVSCYLLIRLEKQLNSLSASINKLNTIISTKLGVTVDTAYLIHNYNTLKQVPEYISDLIGLLKVCVVGSLSSIINSTSLAYINNCCYIAIPRIEGKDSWFKCSSGFFGTLCAYDSDKKKMAKIGWDSVAENSILTITTKYL